MTIEVKRDSTVHHEFVTRKRDMIVRRLVRALDALDRKRHAVTGVVSDVASLLPGSSSHAAHPSPSASSVSTAIEVAPAARNALYGALAG
ncbi:MAG: hypothetical protein JWM10_3535, partial [Myxococcaceae bacterium]|nr:hypothetical protein [Myxococcaceae bacterium]